MKYQLFYDRLYAYIDANFADEQRAKELAELNTIFATNDHLNYGEFVTLLRYRYGKWNTGIDDLSGNMVAAVHKEEAAPATIILPSNMPPAAGEGTKASYLAESVLDVVATVILIVGIVAIVMCYLLSKIPIVGGLGVFFGFFTILFTLSVWAILKVLSSISRSLKKMSRD